MVVWPKAPPEHRHLRIRGELSACDHHEMQKEQECNMKCDLVLYRFYVRCLQMLLGLGSVYPCARKYATQSK